MVMGPSAPRNPFETDSIDEAAPKRGANDDRGASDVRAKRPAKLGDTDTAASVAAVLLARRDGANTKASA